MKKLGRHRYVLAVLVALLMGIGCEGEQQPEGLLTPEQMVPVLKELEIAYSGVDQTIKDPRQRTQKYEEMNSLVLKKNQMDKNQFYSSYQWYENHPQLLDTILKQVVQALNLELSALQNGTQPSK